MNKPEADGDKLVVYLPVLPFEATYTPYSSMRGLRSPHTNDLRLIFIGLVAVLALAWLLTNLQLGSLFSSIAIDNEIASQVATGQGAMGVGGESDIDRDRTRRAPEFLNFQSLVVMSVGGLLAAFITLFELGKRRFATIDLFSMEMLTVMRLFNITNFVGKIIRLYEPETIQNEPFPMNELEKINLSKAEALSGFLLTDHYSDIFSNNMKELGSLQSDVVDYVTAFYTFLKAITEQTRVFFSHIDKGEGLSQNLINSHVFTTMYLIDTLMSCGLRAIDGLVQNDVHRNHAKRLAISAAAPANNFLFENALPEKGMRELTEQRRAMYIEEIKKLDKEAKRLGIALRSRPERS